MEVKYGNGQTEFGPGVAIELTGVEVARAIDAYLVAQGVRVSGPRTITVNDDLISKGYVCVDPSGFVIAGGEKISGRGPAKPEVYVFERDRVLKCSYEEHHFQLVRDPNDGFSFGNWYMVVKNEEGETVCDGWIDDSNGYTAHQAMREACEGALLDPPQAWPEEMSMERGSKK